MRTRLARLGAVIAAIVALVAAPAVTAAPAQAADQWNPPAHLVQPLDEVWNHVESTYPDLYGFRNYGWDQVMANRGSVSYCVRWESDAPVSAALRDRIHTAMKKQFGKWMAAMVESDGSGHNAWPYTSVGAPRSARPTAGASSIRTATTPGAPVAPPATTTSRSG